ncbi:MAG: 5-formyltetrahydrofolate cyclo-ligase [Fervidicoccaceae archaeon]
MVGDSRLGSLCKRNEEIKRLKAEIRESVWRALEEAGVTAPPRPVRGRIPNFIGAERAALALLSTPEWQRAETVKVNPDSPQKHVRRATLLEGKTLVVPTPRLREGFILLEPSRLTRREIDRAATIAGSFKYGRRISLGELRSLGRVDLIVEGSVAVNKRGERLGKGEGYGELEFAVLRELELVDDSTPIATTVHEMQLLEIELPQDPWDVPVDIIATNSRLLRCDRAAIRPLGVLWECVDDEMRARIPILAELERISPRRAR